MAKAFLGVHEFLTQVSKVLTTHVLEFAALEQVPHLFLRIQLGSIARQAFQMEPFAHRAGEKLLDHLCPMNGRAIPNDEQRPGILRTSIRKNRTTSSALYARSCICMKSRPFGVIPPIAERWSQVSLTLWL